MRRGSRARFHPRPADSTDDPVLLVAHREVLQFDDWPKGSGPGGVSGSIPRPKET